MRQLNESWTREIFGAENDRYDNGLTFCGAYEECFFDISLYRSKQTTDQYNRYYDTLILPALKDHNSKCIWEYTREDFEEAVLSIQEEGYFQKGKRKAYAEATIRVFRMLIFDVVFHASAEGLCENVFWGTDFYREKEISPEEEIEKRVVLKKSLSVQQEWDLYSALTEDVCEDGAAVGLLLMFALGLRNAEACGLNFGDIKPLRDHPDCKTVWIYKTTKVGTNTLQTGGKTINSGRIIPIPGKLAEFLTRRREAILCKLQCLPDQEFQIDSLPVCCDGEIGDEIENCKKRCSSQDISNIAHAYFEKAGIYSDQIAFIDAELSSDKTASVLKEKDAKAYLLRRNFATHMHILGLSTAEMQYLIGHNVEDAYETRNEFVNEERIYAMHLKLANRPILNEIRNDGHSNHIRCVPGSVSKIRIVANEPAEEIDVKLSAPSKAKVDSQIFTEGTRIHASRKVSILSEYLHAYTKAKGE